MASTSTVHGTVGSTTREMSKTHCPSSTHSQSECRREPEEAMCELGRSARVSFAEAVMTSALRKGGKGRLQRGTSGQSWRVDWRCMVKKMV